MAKDTVERQKRAQECLDKANAAKDATNKYHWLKMAENWIKLANSADIAQKK